MAEEASILEGLIALARDPITMGKRLEELRKAVELHDARKADAEASIKKAREIDDAMNERDEILSGQEKRCAETQRRLEEMRETESLKIAKQIAQLDAYETKLREDEKRLRKEIDDIRLSLEDERRALDNRMADLNSFHNKLEERDKELTKAHEDVAKRMKEVEAQGVELDVRLAKLKAIVG